MQYIQIRGKIEEKLPYINKPNIEVLPITIRKGEANGKHNLYKVDFVNERIKKAKEFNVGDCVVVEIIMKGSLKNGTHFLNLEASDISLDTEKQAA